jgi:hypothetical protein
MIKVIQVVAVLVSFVFADTIQMRNGQEIKDASVVKISDTDVEYKVGKKAVIYSVKKSEVASILYSDGTKDAFGSVVQNAVPAAVPIAVPSPEPAPSPPAAAPSVEPAKSVSGGESKNKTFGRAELGMTTISLDSDKGEGGGKVKSETGYRFAGGVGTLFPLSASVFFKPQATLYYRTYGSKETGGTVYENGYQYRIEDSKITATEWGLSAAALLYMAFSQSYYINGGIQIDSPLLSCKVKATYEVSDNNSFNCKDDEVDRETFDTGIAFGGGYIIDEQLSLDIIAVIGLTELSKGSNATKVNQFSIGLNYSF